MIQRLFLRDFLTLADRSDQVSDVLHIVSQASYPAVTSSACCDSVTPYGRSSVSAIHNVALHVARSSLFAMGRSIIFIVENGLFSLVRVLSKLIQYPRFEFRIANRTAFESYTAIISKSLDGGASSIPL